MKLMRWVPKVWLLINKRRIPITREMVEDSLDPSLIKLYDESPCSCGAATGDHPSGLCMDCEDVERENSE